MQRRAQIAMLWIAITLMASLVPCVPIAICVVDLVFAVDVALQPLQRATVVRHAQPLSLLAVTLFRGPPSLGSLV